MYGLSAGDLTSIINTVIIVGGVCVSFYQSIKKNISNKLEVQIKNMSNMMQFQNEKLTDSIERLNDTIKETKLDIDELEVKVAEHETKIAVLQKVTKVVD